MNYLKLLQQKVKRKSSNEHHIPWRPHGSQALLCTPNGLFLWQAMGKISLGSIDLISSFLILHPMRPLHSMPRTHLQRLIPSSLQQAGPLGTLTFLPYWISKILILALRPLILMSDVCLPSIGTKTKIRTPCDDERMGTRPLKIQDDEDVDILSSPGYKADYSL